MSFNEVEILDYVENRLTEKRRIEFEQKLNDSEELRSLVKQMKASVLPYDAAFSEQFNEDPPESLYQFLDDMTRAGESEKAPSSPGLMHRGLGLAFAACLCCAFFAFGLLSHELFKTDSSRTEEVFSHYGVPSKLFESMVIYQTLYTRKTIETTNQKAVDTQKVLDGFNLKYDLATVTPDLSSAGYEFRRVQELSYEGLPILQFVYLAQTGEPIAICVTLGNNNDSTSYEKQHIATKFAGMNTLVWQHSNSVYMLISNESPSKLNALTEIVRARQT